MAGDNCTHSKSLSTTPVSVPHAAFGKPLRVGLVGRGTHRVISGLQLLFIYLLLIFFLAVKKTNQFILLDYAIII